MSKKDKNEIPKDYGTYRWAIRQCSIGEHCVNPILPKRGDWRLICRGEQYLIARIDTNGTVQETRPPDRYEIASREWRLYRW